jgi:hypothetical protein
MKLPKQLASSGSGLVVFKKYGKRQIEVRRELVAWESEKNEGLLPAKESSRVDAYVSHNFPAKYQARTCVL